MTFDVVLAVVAGMLVVLGLTARVAKRYALSPVLLSTLSGIALGPRLLGVITPTQGPFDRNTLLEQTTRVALALSVTSIGFRTQRGDVRANWARVVSLLSIGMLTMWLVTAAGAWLVLGLPFPLALLLGAVLTPTDPAVASTLVQGELAERMLPQKLRMTLQLESGVNDGLALPFVLFAGLLGTGSGIGIAGDWALETLRAVGTSLLLGPVVGVSIGALARLARTRGALEETFVPVLAPAASLLTLGVAGLLGASGILAAFLAGMGLSRTAQDQDVRRAVSTAQENFTRVGTTAAFLLFGAVLPWAQWRSLGLAGLLFAGWTLLLRRPVAGVVALAPTDTGPRSVAFLSWFGPLGLGGLYYATYAQRFDLPDDDRFFAAATLAVVVSVLVQGLTATAGLRAYARSAGSEVAAGETSTIQGPLP